jgi:hypothetical protein
MPASGRVRRAEGEREHDRSPVPLTAAPIEFLRQHKAERLRLVSDPPLAPSERSKDDRATGRGAIAERAVIGELDGGEPRAVGEMPAPARRTHHRGAGGRSDDELPV